MAEPRFQIDFSEEVAYAEAADRRRRERQQAAQTVDEGMARRLQQAHEQFPTIPGDALAPLVMAGATAEQLAQVERAQVDVVARQPGLFGRIGEVVTGAGSAVIENVVKPAVRGADIFFEGAADAVFDLPVRLASSGGDFGEAIRGNPAYAAWQALQTPGGGETLDAKQFEEQGGDLGTGFFLGGEARGITEQADVDLALLGGARPTLGGAVAAGADTVLPGNIEVFEPGATGHAILSGVVDFGARIAADPAVAVLGTASRTARASRLIANADRSTASLIREAAVQGPVIRRLRSAAGLIDDAHRPTYIRRAAETWLDSDDGRRVVEFLSDARFDEVYGAVHAGRQPGNIPRQLLLDLADAADPTQVRSRLLTAIAEDADITRTDAFRTPTLRTKFSQSRLNTMMPGSALDVHDLDRGLEQARRWMVNAKMDPDDINRHLRTLANTEDGDFQTAWAAARDMFDDAAVRIAEEGGHIPDELRQSMRAMTRSFDEFASSARRYFNDRLGQTMDHPLAKSVVVDGVEEPLESAHLLTEFLNRSIPLPDARAIRREVTRFDLMRRLYRTKGWQVPVHVVSSFMSGWWKPAQLMRIAWPVRVIGEEQLRMHAFDLDSFANHPIKAFAWATGRKGGADLVGDAFAGADDFAAAMSRRASGFLDDVSKRPDVVSSWTVIDKGDPAFNGAWRRKLAQSWNDPVSRQVADGLDDMDAVKRWFREGEGASLREKLATGAGERGQRLVDDAAAQAAGFRSADHAADVYIDSVAERLRILTGGNDDLMDAVRTGRLDGVRVRGADAADPDTVAGMLDSRLDDAPLRMPYEVAGEGRGVIEMWDDAVNAIFDVLMTRPTNKLSRSPTFRQFYWKNVEELLPYMDPSTARQAVARAADEGVEIAGRGAADGMLTSLDDVDTAAKGRALDQTKDILYDVTERHQWADITRIVFPFGDAWQEVTSRWLRIAKESPQVLRQGQMVLNQGRENGIFYKNDQGAEVFAYPGGGLLGGWMLGGDGASVRFEGRLEGLNLVTAGVGPGFGPVVQWPAGMFLPANSDLDWFRELILPFGSEIESAEDLTPGAIADATLPAWMEKVLQGVSRGGIDKRLWNNNVADVARAMTANGSRTIDSEEELRRTLDDAADRSAFTYVLRGLMQSALPTGPSVTYQAEDETGGWHSLQVLGQKWREIRDSSADETEALIEFTRRFGFEPWFVGQAKTKSLGEAPVSDAGDAWMRDHPELQESYPLTAGLFAPDPNGEFDFNAYYRQIEQGIRQPLTSEQQALLARRSAARMEYNQARRNAEEQGLSGDGMVRYLADVRAYLDETYGPTWDGTILGVPDAANLDERIEELSRIVIEDEVASMPAGQATAAYLDARRQAIARVREETGASNATLGRQDAAGMRRFLRDTAAALIEDTPEFAYIWSRLLRREVQEEEQ